MRNILFLLLLTSCVSEKGVQRYLAKNPDMIEKVYYIDEVHDTTTIVKDSLVVERITDSFYTWFTDTHYIDRWRIKKVLEPCKDSILIVSKQIITDRYKDVYLKAKRDSELNDKALKWWRKGLLLTWAWIVLILLVVYIIKRR
jgi:hypothetical protein